MTEATAAKERRHRITILDTGESYDCAGSTTLLQAMTRLGRKGIPSGCHGGGCGICKIRVLEGEYTTGAMCRSQVSETEQARGFALACRCYPGSDITLKVIGKMHKAVTRRRYGLV
uniref:Plant type ferredoxin-like protein n=1 Tax=Arhodomonas sp. Seminole TaxID=1204713 RepID=J7HFM0_9GAMM|nr:plant type ferredoxin-like protein [Arhodomonas sp. Seminole]